MGKAVAHKVTVEVFRSPWKVYEKGTACGSKGNFKVMTKAWENVTCRRCLSRKAVAKGSKQVAKRREDG